MDQVAKKPKKPKKKKRRGRPVGIGGQAAIVDAVQVYQIADALEAAGHRGVGFRDRCIWLLGLSLGFRCGEVLSLRVQDVWSAALNRPLEEITIDASRTKTRKSRTVNLGADGRIVLIEWMMRRPGRPDPEAPLFCSYGCPMTPLSYCSFLSRLEGIRVGLGMPRLSTHSMRRTGANLLRLSGADLEVIRVFLGHSTIEQTRAYLGVSREERIAAVERHAALLQDARLEASRARPEPVPVLPPCDPLPSPDWSI